MQIGAQLDRPVEAPALWSRPTRVLAKLEADAACQERPSLPYALAYGHVH